MLPVIDQLQKRGGFHLDPAAEQRPAEQPCGFEQINGSNDLLDIKSIDPELRRTRLQGPVMINVFADRGDPESVRKIDDQIIAFHPDVVRPAVMEADGIVGVGFNVVPHMLSLLPAQNSPQHLAYGILCDILIGFTLQKELFRLQRVQFGHISLVRAFGKDHHVGNLSGLQTAALLFVEGHPAGVVGAHLQGMLDRQGNAIFGADLNALVGGQTGVDARVTVILPGIVIQSGIEAAADSAQLAPLVLLYIHGLEIHPKLQTVVQPLGKPVLHIQIHSVG